MENNTRFMLERSTPESVGIPSEKITAMLAEFKKAGLAMHSVMLVRHGKVIAEGYADYFSADYKHRMYSTSKSYAAMAVGLLVEDGLVSLDDTVEELFPEHILDITDECIRKTKLRDVLTMQGPFWKCAYHGYDKNWLETYFNKTTDLRDAGNNFTYDTSGSYLLCVLVEKLTGKTYLEYLQEKALDKMGYSKDAWSVCAPEGHAWGGSGVMCTTEDTTKFALLVLNDGKFEGEQLLPEWYVKEAKQPLADNSNEGNCQFYGQGYGYQIWITKHTDGTDGFAFLGMGDQSTIAVPKHDLLLVTTADNQGYEAPVGYKGDYEGKKSSRKIIFDAFDKYIMPYISESPIEENEEAYENMCQTLSKMSLPVQEGSYYSSMTESIDGVNYYSNGEVDWKRFSLRFENNGGVLSYSTARGEKEIKFGWGNNVLFELNEPQYSGKTISQPKGKGYRTVASAAWTDDNTLVIRVQVIDDYFGNMRLTFDFSDRKNVKVSGKKTAEWFLDEYVMKNIEFKTDIKLNKVERPERIIQFGEGGFLRGFVDWMLQKANESGMYSGNAVVVQPIEQGMCDLLSSQNCVYTHIIRGTEGVEATLINSISRCVKPYENYQDFLDLAKNPDFRFVFSNTTESGISYSEGDKITDTPPKSFPAKVCALLYERFKLGYDGFVFIPCELIEKNGDTLRKIVLRYAAEWELGDEFINWINEKNDFCNSLVDRIVTGYPKDEQIDLGYEDKMLDTSEYFHLWVIEGDKKYAEELPFDKLGLNVIWTDDLSNYRTRKVRILNGAHTSMVPYAMLRGYDTVRSCVESEEILPYVKKCIYEEIIPTLDLPEAELKDYADNVLIRFSNPYIKHYLSSIALNSADKFKVRVMPSILEYNKRFGKYPETLMTAFDALYEFYKTDMVNDSPEKVDFMRNSSKEEVWEWLCNADK